MRTKVNIFVISAIILCTIVTIVNCVQQNNNNHHHRIVGGVEVNIKDFPYQISLQRYNIHVCGGSILNEITIITAAHCVVSALSEIHFIYAGSNTTTSGHMILVNTISIHPEYNRSIFLNDIAILKLTRNLEFGIGIKPINLPKENLQIMAGTNVTVSGWGSLSIGGQTSDYLHAVTIPVVDQMICANALDGHFHLTNRHLCAGAKGRDSCQGDSGGPLALNNELVGVVSWGIGCGLDGYPGVYARVSELLSWINKQL